MRTACTAIASLTLVLTIACDPPLRRQGVPPIAELVTQGEEGLAEGDLDVVWAAAVHRAGINEATGNELRDADARRRSVAAKLVARVEAAWASVAATLTAEFAAAGKARALGEPPDRIERLRALMTLLAAQSPSLASQWAALQPALTAAEQAGFAREQTDTRPLVAVWTPGDDPASVGLGPRCLMRILGAAYPGVKWQAVPRPGADVAQLQVEVSTEADAYTRGGQVVDHLMSGLAVRLTGQHLPPVLGAAFATPIVASARARSPETISGAGESGLYVASLRTGTAQIGALFESVCGDLERQLAPAR